MRTAPVTILRSLFDFAFTVGRALEKALTNIDLNQYVSLTDKVPLAPHAFYKTFGYISHPKTRLPVTYLSSYQIRAWQALLDYKRVIAVDPQMRAFDVAARDILKNYLPSTAL